MRYLLFALGDAHNVSSLSPPGTLATFVWVLVEPNMWGNMKKAVSISFWIVIGKWRSFLSVYFHFGRGSSFFSSLFPFLYISHLHLPFLYFYLLSYIAG